MRWKKNQTKRWIQITFAAPSLFVDLDIWIQLTVWHYDYHFWNLCILFSEVTFFSVYHSSSVTQQDSAAPPG